MKRTVTVLLVLCAFALAFTVGAMAQEPNAPTTTKAPEKSMEKKATAAKHEGMAKAAAHMPIANEVAVCACGTVFRPDAKTKYITYEGKRYAVCSDNCDKNAAKDPAAFVKAVDENMKKLTEAAPAPKS